MQFDPSALAFAVDERGVPVEGRRAEHLALFNAGYSNLSFGRLFEGHVNALELVGRLGTPEQRDRARRDASAGRLFGVWNTQDPHDGVKIVAHGGRRILRGRKTFASGAGTVARGMITAALPEGGLQLMLLRMDEIDTPVDRFSWRPVGMEQSDSFAISFDEVPVGPSDLIGAPNTYETPPWFLGGAFRYIAVQTGGLARLRSELSKYLGELGRAQSPFQQIRVAEIAVAVETAQRWIDAGADAWAAFDEAPSAARADAIVALADMARVAVEKSAFEVIERVEKAVGARGLLDPHPFGRLLRDLTMYVRQPAPDATLVRIAEREGAASAERKSAVARATGTRP
ncbi:MAG: acyl-CoA dehydrogenase [Candidatus Eremiobacteraeota bacterium]|nr:acyl-CoA dehydrogenase [Candidatus Eremiobacteraeota bacterium]